MNLQGNRFDLIRSLTDESIKPINIMDDLKSFLSEEVLEMCKTVIEETGDPESTELHTCFIAKTVVGEVSESSLKWLGDYVNWAKGEGILEGGILCPPFKIKLTTPSTVERWLLCFYPFTKIPNSKLIKNDFSKPMSREEVYMIIDGERNYQDLKWHPKEHGSHEVESYILYMEYHLQEARKAISTQKGVKGGLEELRKVVGLGVACFEKHGVPARAF